MHRARGRGDDEGQAVGRQDAGHFREDAPELPAVLKHLAGHDQIDRAVPERQPIRVFENHIHTRAGCEIDADVFNA